MAAFKLKSFKVKTAVIGNGTVSVEEPGAVEKGTTVVKAKKEDKVKRSKHEAMINYGDELVYSITPEPGNYITQVMLDGKPIESTEKLTLAEVKRNHSMKVKFASETKSAAYKKSSHVKHHVVVRDTYMPYELENLPDESGENDDDSIEPSFPNHYASVTR